MGGHLMERSYSGAAELRGMAIAVKYNNFLARFIATKIPQPGPILDFGAGIGTISQRLRDLGYDVRCLEPDKRQAAELESLGFKVYRSIEQIEDQSYSAIYSLNVLEHIQDDRGTLAKIIPKLQPGGQILIYVPAFPSLYTMMDENVGHVRRYRMKQLTAMLEDLGCVIETRRYVDSMGFLATLIFKWLGNKDGSVNLQILRAYDRAIFPISRLLDILGAQWVFGKNIMVTARCMD